MSAPRDASPAPDLQPEADRPQSIQERIYEWSTELPGWQRDLLRRLATGTLSGSDETEILKILLATADAPAPRPLERSDLPADELTTEPVELRQIRDVQNINLLAAGQALCFKPGLNVVFGATGAGKSGYGRLLRRLCQPIDSIEVLRNVFDLNADAKQQTAIVHIAVGSDVREIAVDLGVEPDRALSAMSVFDASLAPTNMSKPSVIEHVPEPLLLLRRLAETQEALRSRVKKQIVALQAELSVPEVKPGTPVGRLVETITAETDLEELERLASLNDEERAEMRRLDTAVAAFRAHDSREQENAARSRAQVISKVAQELERAAERLSDERLAAIAELRERLDEAVTAERAMATDAFSEQTHPGTGQAAWRKMWEAARRFVESEDGDFPAVDTDSSCPLCQQHLSGEARERLTKLEAFVESELRQKIASLTEQLSQTVGAIPDISMLASLVDASLSGASEKATAAAAAAIDALSARADLARRLAKSPSADRGTAPEIPTVMPIRAYADEQLSAAETQAALRDEAAQQRLIDRRTALRGREELAAALPAIGKHIGALRKIDRCKKASVALRTQKVSGQLRKLQEDVLTSRLRTAIIAELKALELLAAEIDVAGKARGGRAAIEFGLRGSVDVKVGAVLSEGEQRALALAFFLAESAVSSSQSAIVLDDPAALLDRDRCQHVAARLTEEARRRQVIVFTHDLAFVQMLRRSAADSGQELSCQALRRAYGRAGILGDVPPTNGATAATD